MISYSINKYQCYLFNHICNLSSTQNQSSVIWYKNNIRLKHFKATPIPTINISKLRINNSVNRILTVTIEDIWYIPVIIILFIILCWICCWIGIKKCKLHFSGSKTNDRHVNAETADVELQELTIDPVNIHLHKQKQTILDPAKLKNGATINKSNANHGALIYQKRYFNAAQLKFVSEMNIKCKILFGDNDEDNNRKQGIARRHFGGQAGIIGKYDRHIGYGIITTFFQRYRLPKTQDFAKLMDEQFEPLKKYIVSGYDIVIPYPSKQDVKKRYQMYYGDDGHGTNKQIIFHNLGTGIAQLSFENIYYIQRKIMNLQLYASGVKVVEYYGYDPSMNKDECPLCNQVKIFLITFTNCKHKICEQCLKEYIVENFKAYKDNKIDVKFECWAAKLNKCSAHLCLKDVNYPATIGIYLQKNRNGTILDNKTYKMYKDIMLAYDESLALWKTDICPNEKCLKPFKISRKWEINDVENTNSDSSGTVAAGKIFCCNCCGDEIHGVQYNDDNYASNEDLLEEKYDEHVFFDIFYCNICEKKFCRKCRQHCFYAIETAMQNNIKTPAPIAIKFGNYKENDHERLECCEICWFKYYCRHCPHCKYKFCGICHSKWNGVTTISKKQRVIYKKNNGQTVRVIHGGKVKHDSSSHHSCKKMMRKRKKSQHNKLYENAARNEELKTLKLKLVGEKHKNQTLETEIKEMKNEIYELEEKKEFETQKKNDIAKIEKKIAKIEKKIKKINKEAIWEWKENKNVWRLYDNETIKQIEKLKVGSYFEYTLLANNQTYKITKLWKTRGEQINIHTGVRRRIRRSERDKNSESVKYPFFWAHINKQNNYLSDGSYAKAHFSKLKHADYRDISDKFYETVHDNSITITSIESVENRFLWDKYYHAKIAMKKLMGGHNINEKELWHGTKYNIIDVICTEGFRKEFNNVHAFGEGTYFARDASYSIGYAKPNNGYGAYGNKYRMFLCKVLCGESAKGDKNIKLQDWPKRYIGSHSGLLIYDSLVDNTRDPTIYVIHDDIRAYPMYIIHFKKN